MVCSTKTVLCVLKRCAVGPFSSGLQNFSSSKYCSLKNDRLSNNKCSLAAMRSVKRELRPQGISLSDHSEARQKSADRMKLPKRTLHNGHDRDTDAFRRCGRVLSRYTMVSGKTRWFIVERFAPHMYGINSDNYLLWPSTF